MGKLKDLSGQKIGRLKIEKRVGMAKHGECAKWLCICECGKEVIKSSRYFTDKCNLHPSCGCWKQELSALTQTKRNSYEIVNNDVIMYTNNTNVPFIIDKDDLEKVKQYTWMENKRGYIVSTNGYKKLHHVIVGNPPHGLVVDHVDRNKKNNRKANLVFKTQTDNAKNRTVNKNNSFGISGVHYSTRKDLPYQATLGAKGNIFKENFSTLEEAIIARLKAEKEYWGEKAPQKHLFKEYGIE